MKGNKIKENKIFYPPGTDLLTGKSYIARYISFLIKNKCSHTADEYRLFPFRKAERSPVPSVIDRCITSYPESFSIHNNGTVKEENIDELLNSTESTAFLVMKDGKLIVEKYYNGFNRNSICRIYSITKSFISALTGIAVGEGLIKSIDESVSKYIPELSSRANAQALTIRHLLLMNKGIRLKDGYAPWEDEPKAYLSWDSRKLVLNCGIDKLSGHFHYNDYHLLLLGLILQRVAGTSLTEFFHSRLWHHMGAEYDAFFSCDSKEKMFEKAESGLNIRAIDLLRFGQLYLNGGSTDGNQIVPPQWIKESTSPLQDSIQDRYSYYNNHPWGRLVFNKPQNYYKYLWWGSGFNNDDYDYYALGILGQVLYISPRRNTIAIRLGNKWGIRDWWPRVLKGYIDKL